MSAAPQKTFWPPRWWWMGLVVILIIAGALRFTGYNFSLPYVDHPDEPAYVIAARYILDEGSPKPIGMHGYPPGIITINYFLLRWFFRDAPMLQIVGLVRLLAITASLSATALLALIGYRIGPAWGGLLAAGIWAILPWGVEVSRYATADTFVTAFTLLSLFLALSSLAYDRDRWATAAVVALMLAIAFKYQAIFITPVILGLPILRLLSLERAEWRYVIKNAVINILDFAVFFFWLFALFPALEATESPNFSAATEALGLPGLPVLIINWTNVTAQFNNLVLLGGLIGLLFLLWPRFRRQTNLWGVAALLLAGLAWFLGVSLYNEQAARQFMGIVTLLIAISALGWSGWLEALRWAISEAGRRLDSPALTRRSRAASAGILLVGLAILLLPDFQAATANAIEHTLPDRRNDLAVWMDTSLEPGAYISPVDNHKTLNPAWGGYTGIHEYPYLAMSGLGAHTVEEWRERGAAYAIVNFKELEELQAADSPLLDEVTLLKEYPPSDAYRGPSMAVLRLYPIQHEASGQLGPIHLIGYDLDQTTVTPGEALTFRLYWQADAPTDASYVVYNHLTTLDGREPLAQFDGPPLVDDRRLPDQWDDPEETLVSREFTLLVGVGVPPGEYRLITGFYRPDTGERLLTPDGADYLLLTTVQVMAETTGDN